MTHAVAIVHDYLTQRGGAERVVLAMSCAFPDAPIYTAVYEPGRTFPEFAGRDVRPLWTQRVAGLRADHRRGLLLYPFVFSTTRVHAQVTLCSTSGFAHGVRTSGAKIVYCHTPPRWLYSEADAYLQRFPRAVRAAARVVRAPLRRWDRHAARSTDLVLVNSSVTAARVRAVYGRDAHLLPPPVTIDVDGPVSEVDAVDPGFLLCIGRLMAYKNVDAVVRAMELLPERRLVVAGTGPEESRLRRIAGPNVTFVGSVSDAQVRWLYSSCVALVSASYEDFGLTPVEAAAFGKPSVVLRDGGFLDTVVDGVTGEFFDDLDASSIARAVEKMSAQRWDAATIEAHASRYDLPSFCSALLDVVRVAPR